MRGLFEWFVEQKSWLSFGVAAAIIGVTLLLWFIWGIFWPWGFVVGTVLAFIGIFMGRK